MADSMMNFHTYGKKKHLIVDEKTPSYIMLHEYAKPCQQSTDSRWKKTEKEILKGYSRTHPPRNQFISEGINIQLERRITDFQNRPFKKGEARSSEDFLENENFLSGSEEYGMHTSIPSLLFVSEVSLWRNFESVSSQIKKLAKW
ncbi:uncharacterized protein LOC125664886 isoform X2 [Ostrea edulis]|uniref:uncharacterized protein LOC125664886 isoform X2 n=1 Tax=Ostrea edulis TaxID=37623 RepID=UPI0024AFD5D0|nr:uncharacterized protein LOC125664886 isoform X2 [Ostrea edulis]